MKNYHKGRIFETGEFESLSYDASSNGQVVATRRNHETGDVFVALFVKGHNYWAARGERGYAPAEFQVYRLHSAKQKEGYSFMVVELERIIEFGKSKQETPVMAWITDAAEKVE